MQNPRQAKAGRLSRPALLAGGALLVLVLLVYSNSFGPGFPLDNRGLILDDARIRAVTPENIDRIVNHTYWWPIGESGLYRPFTTLSYLFNYVVLGNGQNAAGYHWINLLLHAGNVLLVWILARKLWGEGLPAWFAAAGWAVHPVLTESVTNIVGRADLLSGAAVLSGLWLYLRSRESAGWRRAAWLAGLMAVTAIGAFSKESSVAILGVIALWAWSIGGRKEIMRAAGALVAAGIPIAWMLWQRAAVLARSGPTEFPFTDNPIVGAGWLEGRLIALRVMARYAGLLIWPAKLSCDYSYAQIPLSGAGDWVAWGALGAMVGGAVLLWRLGRSGICLALAAVVVFLPTSNLLFPIGTIMAERFLYLPSIAFAVGVVWVMFKVARGFGMERWAPALLGIVICAWGARTFARNADWRDDLTLSAATVQTSPKSFKAHKMRANALVESDPNHANIDQAITEAERSLAILDGLPADRNDADMYRRAGGYYFMKGDMLRRQNDAWSGATYRRAAQLFERGGEIARAAADRADAESQLARLYLRLNQPGQALRAAMKARELDPESVEAHRVAVGLLLDAGSGPEAASALVAGVLITKDAGLRRELTELYRGGLDRLGCAITAGGTLNPGCEAVRQGLCTGSAEAIRLRVGSERPELAEDLRRTAEREFGCAPGELERVR